MSKILVDTIDTRSGTSTLTLVSSNAGTIALGSGDVQSNFMYPAFHAYPNSTITMSNATKTVMPYDTELYDTDSAYDTSNYRFTVPSGKAGKYFFHGMATDNYTSSAAGAVRLLLYKNGSQEYYYEQNGRTSNLYGTLQISATMNLAVGDYVQLYGYLEGGSGVSFRGGDERSNFIGYRIGT